VFLLSELVSYRECRAEQRLWWTRHSDFVLAIANELSRMHRRPEITSELNGRLLTADLLAEGLRKLAALERAEKENW
jgi:ribulose 1,5-bisphosphate carboxylase large subunit-like protein